jgi:hypothetical protein
MIISFLSLGALTFGMSWMDGDKIVNNSVVDSSVQAAILDVGKNADKGSRFDVELATTSSSIAEESTGSNITNVKEQEADGIILDSRVDNAALSADDTTTSTTASS